MTVSAQAAVGRARSTQPWTRVQHVHHVGAVDRRVGEDVVDHRGQPPGLVADGGQPALGVTHPGLRQHQDRGEWLAKVVAQCAYGVDAGGVAQGVGVGQSSRRHRSSPVSSSVRSRLPLEA